MREREGGVYHSRYREGVRGGKHEAKSHDRAGSNGSINLHYRQEGDGPDHTGQSSLQLQSILLCSCFQFSLWSTSCKDFCVLLKFVASITPPVITKR